MSAVAEAPVAKSPRVAELDGWTVWEYPVVDSTNRVAAGLRPWEAVRADTQTSGRGRFQRSWVSDAGGLWLSAVLPVTPLSPAERALPLVAGLSIAESLRTLGVRQLRLRWPNDVLVGDRKLAGLLIEKFTPGMAVVGIGVNVCNRPEACDIRLKNQTTRLADILPHALSLDYLAALILRGLRNVMGEIGTGRLPFVLTRVNEFWAGPQRVELDLDGELRRGKFGGIEDDGRLILWDESGIATTFQPHEVKHLKEIPDSL